MDLTTKGCECKRAGIWWGAGGGVHFVSCLQMIIELVLVGLSDLLTCFFLMSTELTGVVVLNQLLFGASGSIW